MLFEATAGAAAAAAVLGFVLHDCRPGPAWPALGWLVLLALTSQVIGWLLIKVSMPRLAAGMIGALLLSSRPDRWRSATRSWASGRPPFSC